MKIAFLTQMGFTGKVPRNHPNMRTEFAQMCALNADHFPLYDVDKIAEGYDHVVLMIPKTQQDRDNLYNIDIVSKSRRVGKHVWFMQEGPSWIFQDLPIHQQFWHYNVLMDVDGILTENRTDIPYYRGLVGGDKPIHNIPSLMITDDIISNTTENNSVILGGNFVRWYGGFDSYVVSKIFQPEYSLHCVSMGRKQTLEDQIEDISYLPYVQWREWIEIVGKFRVGIHLMPTIAAGTFAMNCSFHGIPVIGYEEADTQRDLHPVTSVKIGDIESARNLAHKLKDNDNFYNECSKVTRELYEKFYTEVVFLEHMNKVFGSL
ncbi:hypothetical protein H8D04_01165 [bacterium]|nr:hypothetical protein [bacterium]